MSEVYKILDTINDPSDLRKLPIEELKPLAEELRKFLIKSVSETSGHLASGLGVVELTIALHYIYDTPNDKLIWDVGHQAYPHKILTGRREKMSSIRKKGGLHPFLWRDESPYDVFSTGHASTSISEALGIAIANRIIGNNSKVVAVIGDGALTGGVAFEALNHAGDLGEDMLIILNDNEMSISESVGGLAKHLAKWLSSPYYAKIIKSGKDVLQNLPLLKDFALKAQEHIKGMVVPGTLFEEFGFNYVGPINGNDIETLVSVLRNMRDLKGPQILHIATKKGKGYLPAEENPTMYHGVPKFDPPTGVSQSEKHGLLTFSDVFGKWLMYTAQKDKKLVAITPAMCQGSGMSEFANEYPKRFFDVAIAEQHAVLLASGLSVGGLHPIVCVYSTFLQRAYDQLIHDIAIQNLPVVVAIDRAGIVGPDGPTHQGVFDIGFIRSIPNMSLLAPSSLCDMWKMLNSAISYNKPIAIRYPRGCSVDTDLVMDNSTIEIGKGSVLITGSQICVMGWGPLIMDVYHTFTRENINFTVVDMRTIKPIDKDLIIEMAKNHSHIITLEDGMIAGGIGEEVANIVQVLSTNCRVHCVGISDEFVEQGTANEIYQLYGMDAKSILAKAKSLV